MILWKYVTSWHFDNQCFHFKNYLFYSFPFPFQKYFILFFFYYFANFRILNDYFCFFSVKFFDFCCNVFLYQNVMNFNQFLIYFKWSVLLQMRNCQIFFFVCFMSNDDMIISEYLQLFVVLYIFFVFCFMNFVVFMFFLLFFFWDVTSWKV